ncbi:MAG: hypothetical protein ACK5HY_01295 [Parahaliea sp.]
MAKEHESDSVLRGIDHRLDSVAERVSKVEGTLYKKSEKSLLKKLSEYGGLVALVISISIGIFTLYDKIILSPQKSEYESEKELRSHLSQLTEIMVSISDFNWKNDPVGSADRSQVYTPRRHVLLEDILLKRRNHPGVLKLHDYVLLARELEYFSRLPESLVELNSALELAQNDYEKASITADIGRVFGLMEDFESMDKMYQKAAELFKRTKRFESPTEIAAFYIGWIHTLLMHGFCEESRESSSMFFSELININFSPNILDVVIDRYKEMLQYVPTSCPTDDLENMVRGF